MSSTFCDACSSIPWTDLLDGRSGTVHSSSQFRYHPLPASGVVSDECSLCRILFSSDLELGLKCVTVRVESYCRSTMGESGAEHPRIRSVIFERALTDRHTIVIAEFNVCAPCGTDSKHPSKDGTSHYPYLGHLVANVPVPVMLLSPCSWMKTCIQAHRKCRPTEQLDLPLPTRLLDIGLQSADAIRLFETPTGSCGRYAALSHCWGNGQTFTTSLISLLARKTDIRFRELPLTFQDAVTVSRSLGLNYLWIDSLCIIQGDGGDWKSEAHRMKAVYSNATLVISASRSTADSSGFLSPRIIGEVIAVASGKEEKEPALYLQRVIDSLTPCADPLVSEPLHKRAWTLQERYLATRTLSFGSNQMFWECKTHFLAEDGRRQETLTYCVDQLVPIKMDLTRDRVSSEELVSHKPWYSMVEAFMSCDITFQSDRLPAISGLAEHLWLKTGDRYLTGLWKSSLICGLMWRKYRCVSLQRQEIYRAPSWSWASVEGKIEFCIFTWFNQFPGGIESFAAIHDCDVEVDGSLFGNVTKGHILLEAPIFSVHGRKGPFSVDDFPELSHGRSGVYLQSFGSFHRVFDWIFSVEFSQHTIFISGSFDFPPDQHDDVDLYMIFLAGDNQSPLDPDEESQPSNEGCFGLLIQKRLGNGDVYSRVGVVHGKFMAEDDGLEAWELFEKYRTWRKQDYLASIGEIKTRPSWYSVPFNEQEKAVVTLV